MEIIPKRTATLFSSTAGKLIGEKGQGFGGKVCTGTGDWRAIAVKQAHGELAIGAGRCR
jgi:hypothetical protein